MAERTCFSTFYLPHSSGCVNCYLTVLVSSMTGHHYSWRGIFRGSGDTRSFRGLLELVTPVGLLVLCNFPWEGFQCPCQSSTPTNTAKMPLSVWNELILSGKKCLVTGPSSPVVWPRIIVETGVCSVLDIPTRQCQILIFLQSILTLSDKFGWILWIYSAGSACWRSSWSKSRLFLSCNFESW